MRQKGPQHRAPALRELMWPQSACLSTLGASTNSARETIDGATRLSAGRAAPSGVISQLLSLRGGWRRLS